MIALQGFTKCEPGEFVAFSAWFKVPMDARGDGIEPGSRGAVSFWL
jgi:hypothetical protein